MTGKTTSREEFELTLTQAIEKGTRLASRLHWEKSLPYREEGETTKITEAIRVEITQVLQEITELSKTRLKLEIPAKEILQIVIQTWAQALAKATRGTSLSTTEIAAPEEPLITAILSLTTLK